LYNVQHFVEHECTHISTKAPWQNTKLVSEPLTEKVWEPLV
jgi:hypothetical protein